MRSNFSRLIIFEQKLLFFLIWAFLASCSTNNNTVIYQASKPDSSYGIVRVDKRLTVERIDRKPIELEENIIRFEPGAHSIDFTADNCQGLVRARFRIESGEKLNVYRTNNVPDFSFIKFEWWYVKFFDNKGNQFNTLNTLYKSDQPKKGWPSTLISGCTDHEICPKLLKCNRMEDFFILGFAPGI